MIYIYALVDPRNNQIKYIGKSKNLNCRYNAHIRGDENKKKTNWVKKLLRNNLKPEIVILEECQKDTWQDAEIWWIALLRKMNFPLTNICEGGESPPIKRGKDNFNYINRGKLHPAYGRVVTNETRKKIGNANRGKKNGMYGKTFKRSKEAIEKARQSHLGKKRSKETREKLRQSHLGYVMPEEQKRKISESNKGKKLSQKHIEILRQVNIGKCPDEKTRLKMSQAKLGDKNPNYKKPWNKERRQLNRLSHLMFDANKKNNTELVIELNEQYKKIKGQYNPKYNNKEKS